MGVKKFGMASSSNIRKGKELRWNEKRTEQKKSEVKTILCEANSRKK